MKRILCLLSVLSILFVSTAVLAGSGEIHDNGVDAYTTAEADALFESHTSNDIDPDRIAGDSDDDNLLDQDAMEMVESGVTDITDDTEWHPTGYKYCVWRLTGDTDPCALILSETDTTGSAFSEGDKMLLVNAGTSVFEIGDIDGQQEVLPSGGTNYIPQNGMFKAIYSGSAWHISPLATDRVSFDTINARVKTFSFSGRSGTYQISDITTWNLTEAESCGYVLYDPASATTPTIVLPDADPGSGYVGELGQLLICRSGDTVVVTSGTTVLVDGTATAAATGAVITSCTIGEYITWEPYYDVAASDWRWAIRIKDD